MHLACLCGSSTEITRRIIDVYPNAAAMPDTPEHQLPFHIAISHNAPFERLQIILNAYPGAVKTHTKTRGFLPLHMACCHRKADAAIVKFLLEKYPDGAMVRQKKKIVIPIVVELKKNFISLIYCFEYFNKAKTKVCRSLPIHLAARYGAGMDVIQLLTHAYPQGLGEKNVHGETPFISTYTNQVCMVSILFQGHLQKLLAANTSALSNNINIARS